MIFFITLGPEVIESEYERKIKKNNFLSREGFWSAVWKCLQLPTLFEFLLIGKECNRIVKI